MDTKQKRGTNTNRNRVIGIVVAIVVVAVGIWFMTRPSQAQLNEQSREIALEAGMPPEAINMVLEFMELFFEEGKGRLIVAEPVTNINALERWANDVDFDEAWCLVFKNWGTREGSFESVVLTASTNSVWSEDKTYYISNNLAYEPGPAEQNNLSRSQILQNVGCATAYLQMTNR